MTAGQGPSSWNVVILAMIAAGLFWFGYVLELAGAFGDVLLSVLGGAIIAPVVFLLVSPRGVLARFAALLLATVPVVVLLLLLIRQPAGSGIHVTFGAWPFVVSAIAAAFGLYTLAVYEGRAVATGAMFPLGAAVLTAAISFAAYLGVDASMLAKTFVHLALSMLSAILFAGLLIVLLSRALPLQTERFLRSLIGLLPLLGFSGTILGIMAALRSLPGLFSGDGDQQALSDLLAGLATAFETTLIGLIAAICASFALTLLRNVLDDQDG